MRVFDQLVGLEILFVEGLVDALDGSAVDALQLKRLKLILLLLFLQYLVKLLALLYSAHQIEKELFC
jgi:hypothetical protein